MDARLPHIALSFTALLLAAACGRTFSSYDPREGRDGGLGYADARAEPADAELMRRDGGATRPDASAEPRDAGHASDAARPPDAGVDPCNIPCSGLPEERPVYAFSECTPPLQIGCPAKTCTVGSDECGQGSTCQQCGAAACCVCAACVPACVMTGPAMGPLPEYLKITPTFGTAYRDQVITVQGFPFYVGALYYLVRVGDSGDLFQGAGTACGFQVEVPGQGFGIEPVWVSQYGGDEPWVLAGFFTFSGGVLPECVQPGYPCLEGQPCCETPEVPMACVSGRCRRR